MAKKLDKHYKCSKALKTMFALRPADWPKDGLGMKRTMMAAENHANGVERGVQSQLVPLPKKPGEPAEQPKKKFGAEKYDQPKGKKAA